MDVIEKVKLCEKGLCEFEFTPFEKRIFSRCYWELIRTIIEERELNQSEISRSLGKPRSFLSNLFTRSSFPSDDMIELFHRTFKDHRIAKGNIMESFQQIGHEKQLKVMEDFNLSERNRSSTLIKKIESKLPHLNDEQLNFILGEILGMLGGDPNNKRGKNKKTEEYQFI